MEYRTLKYNIILYKYTQKRKKSIVIAGISHKYSYNVNTTRVKI